MSRFVNPVPQFYLNNGDIASAGKLYFYETGTTTKKDTFSDFAQSIKNTNPVILSGEGRCPNIFGNGRYTVVFKDSNDIEQWSRDDVELTVEIGQYADWSPILTYRVNDIVRGSDGEYYRSITSTNTGNDPTTSASNWEEIAFLSVWNANVTYTLGDVVFFENRLYQLQTSSSTNNIPDESSTTIWEDLNTPAPWLSTVGYNEDDLVIYQGALYRSNSVSTQTGNIPGASSEWEQISVAQESDTVAPDGDFDPLQTLFLTKLGNVVTITSDGPLLHTNLSEPSTLSGLIPVEYRPTAATTNVYYAQPGTSIRNVRVESDGTFKLQYVDYTGALDPVGGTGTSVSISYIIT